MMGLASSVGRILHFAYPGGNRESWHAVGQPEAAEQGRTRPRHRHAGGDVRPPVVVIVVDVDVSVSGGHRRQPSRRGHVLEDGVALAVEPFVEVQAHGGDLPAIIGRAGVVFGDGYVGAPVAVDVTNGDARVEVDLRPIGVRSRSY